MNVKCDEGRIVDTHGILTERKKEVTRSQSSDNVVDEAHDVVGAVHGALHVPPGNGRGLSPGEGSSRQGLCPNKGSVPEGARSW